MAGDCPKQIHPDRTRWFNFLLPGNLTPHTFFILILASPGSHIQHPASHSDNTVQDGSAQIPSWLTGETYRNDCAVWRVWQWWWVGSIFWCMLISQIRLSPRFVYVKIKRQTLNLHLPLATKDSTFTQVCPVHIGSFGHNSDEVIISGYMAFLQYIFPQGEKSHYTCNTHLYRWFMPGLKLPSPCWKRLGIVHTDSQYPWFFHDIVWEGITNKSF